MAARTLNWKTLRDGNGLATGVELRANEEAVKYLIHDLPAAMQAEVAAYGLKQVLADSVSGVKDFAGKCDGIAEKYDQLLNGDWTAQRTGLWIEALARVGGGTVEQAREIWNGLPTKEQNIMKKKPIIETAVLEIRRERLAARATDLDDGAQAVADLFIQGADA